MQRSSLLIPLILVTISGCSEAPNSELPTQRAPALDSKTWGLDPYAAEVNREYYLKDFPVVLGDLYLLDESRLAQPEETKIEVPVGLQPGFAEHGSRAKSEGCVFITLPYFLLRDLKISTTEHREIDTFLRPYREMKNGFFEIRLLTPNLVEVVRFKFEVSEQSEFNTSMDLVHDYDDTLIIEKSNETWHIREKPSWFR